MGGRRHPRRLHRSAQSMSIHQFHATHDEHRPRSSWHHVLDMAEDPSEVFARLREFVSSFTPYEIESLPAQLRPPKLFDASDVTGYAYELVQYQLAHGEPPEVIHAFSDVFGY